MDQRLQVTETPRAGIPNGLAATPLVAIAWRAMRSEHVRRQEEEKRVQDGLAAVAELAYRLRGIARSTASDTKENGTSRELPRITAQLQAALTGLGLTILAPEGQPFRGDVIEMFENIAQLPKPEITEPCVAEVLSPAILYRGSLVRMGRVVVAVPAEPAAGGSATPSRENPSQT